MKNHYIIHILLVTILGFLAYSNTLDVPFHFDDIDNIVDNPLIRDLSLFTDTSKAQSISLPKNIEWAKDTRYVGYLTFALNYWLHGISASGYHIVNLIVHIMNALLVYTLILLSFRTPFVKNSSLREYSGLGALFAALLFVSHPVQTQAVTYIVQRFTSLATMFYLLSLVLYVRARLSGRVTPASVFLYFFSLICAMLAMKTKEISITLPVSVLLYEAFFLQGIPRRRALLLTPLFIAALIIPLTLLDIDKPLGEVLSDATNTTKVSTDLSRSDYLLTQFRVVTTYIRLLFLPVNQNLDYDYPVFHSFFNVEVVLSCVFLSCIVGLGIFLFYHSRKADPGVRLISFGIFWFFITLSVESSIIPIEDIIFEHRIYLPSVGFFAVISSGAFMLVKRVNNDKLRRLALPLLFILPLVAFTVATYARNGIWRSEISLWEDVVRKSPLKARPHNNLAYAYSFKGFYDKAMEHYRFAIKLKPLSIEAHFNLGILYRMRGDLIKAQSEFETVLQINPDDQQAREFLRIIRKNSSL